MKKILITVLTLALILGLIGTGASALFWDTETSTPNSFSAGTLDLKVDGRDDVSPYGQTNYVIHFDESCLAPHDGGCHTFDLTNAGCMNGTLTMRVSPYTEDCGDNPEPETMAEIIWKGCEPGPMTVCNDATLDEQLHITIWEDDNNDSICDPINETVLLDGNVGSYDYTGIFGPGGEAGGNLPTSEVGVLSQGNNTPLAISYELGAEGLDHKYIGFCWYVEDWDPGSFNHMSNMIMGDSVSFDIEFRLDQIVGVPGPYLLDNKTHLAEVYVDTPVEVCVDVTNTGTADGSYTRLGNRW